MAGLLWPAFALSGVGQVGSIPTEVGHIGSIPTEAGHIGSIPTEALKGRGVPPPHHSHSAFPELSSALGNRHSPPAALSLSLMLREVGLQGGDGVLAYVTSFLGKP